MRLLLSIFTPCRQNVINWHLSNVSAQNFPLEVSLLVMNFSAHKICCVWVFAATQISPQQASNVDEYDMNERQYKNDVMFLFFPPTREERDHCLVWWLDCPKRLIIFPLGHYKYLYHNHSSSSFLSSLPRSMTQQLKLYVVDPLGILTLLWADLFTLFAFSQNKLSATYCNYEMYSNDKSMPPKSRI